MSNFPALVAFRPPFEVMYGHLCFALPLSSGLSSPKASLDSGLVQGFSGGLPVREVFRRGIPSGEDLKVLLIQHVIL